MNSIKRMLLLALAALSVAAFAAPGIAAAEEWTKNGTELGAATAPVFSDEGFPVEEGADTIALQGNVGFESEYGGSECTWNAAAKLGAKSSLGWVTEVSIDPESCKFFGGLSHCKATSATVNELPWGLVAGSTTMDASVDLTLKLTGNFFCLWSEVTYSDWYHLTPDNPKAINSLTPGGELLATFKRKNGTIDEAMATASGELNVSPAGRYGMEEVSSVNLSGSLQWKGNTVVGEVSCSSMTATLAMRPGGGGAIKSFAVDPAKCSTSGGSLSTCTVSSVVPKNAPWSITNEGTHVKISNFAFQMNFTGGSFCWPPSLDVEGTMSLTPGAGEGSAISKTSLSGTTTTTKYQNNTFSGSWTGSWNWSPGGVYGL